MKIGYACLTVGIPNTNFRTCILKNANPEKLHELIGHNLKALKNILEFNAENDIKLFRITSDLIPFGSSPVNKLDWVNLFSDEFREIGRFIRENDIRVSMHPGQYTVLNSLRNDVVDRAIEDLIYHTKVLDALQTDFSSKIILHIGGVYGYKASAKQRFISTYKKLDTQIKNRLVIENDDKSYNINDVLEISEQCSIPIIYDNLHNTVNSYNNMPHSYWINRCKKTWKSNDGTQKIHYSQQRKDKSPGAHTQTIEPKEFLSFIKGLNRDDIDIMLEVKDKNISALKCNNILFSNQENLKKEWQRYEYKVMEHSYEDYLAVKEIYENEKNPLKFYEAIDIALNNPPELKLQVKTASEIFDKMKHLMSEKDIKQFHKLIEKLKDKKSSIQTVKRFLYKFAVNSNTENIKNSLYFHIID